MTHRVSLLKEAFARTSSRPEAIKLCPVVLHFREHAPEWQTTVCVTAQHRDLLDRVLAAFGVTPDYDLNVMRSGQNLFQSTTRILNGLERVAHIEAGLRFGDMRQPFPEEMSAAALLLLEHRRSSSMDGE